MANCHLSKEEPEAMKEASAVTKADPPPSKADPPSLEATETNDDSSSEEDVTVVEELKSIRHLDTIQPKKWLYIGLYCLIMVTVGSLVYVFFSPESNDVDLSKSDEDSSHDATGDDVVFLPSITINTDNANNENAFGSADYDLVDTRQSLSNFDYGAYTFLRTDQSINEDQRIPRRPESTEYYLQQQSDGNLVLFNERQNVFWSSGIVHSPSSSRRYWTKMQRDGNLVTYSSKDGINKVEWASNSQSSDNDYVLVLSPGRDGLMIVRRNNGQIIWSTASPITTAESNPTPSSNGRITYVPGKLTIRENGLLLSEGLRSRRVARVGQTVLLDGKGNQQSQERFHPLPDGAAVFDDPSTGGWVYVSNSEVKEPRGRGGVGAIYFDRNGRVTNYRMIQRGTTANCSGGKTPWNSWVTCEETSNGRCLQVDPFTGRGIQEMNIDRGAFEAFAYDIRDRNHPRFFVTEDAPQGALRRFSPSEKNWNDPWQLLHAPGTLQWLVLEPRGSGFGTFRWTTDRNYARTNAGMYYPFSEGLDVFGNQLYFTIKERKQLFILDLDRSTYVRQSTRSGVFDGMPDQVARIVGDEDHLLYFCEEGGNENGVHARDSNGRYFTVLESDTFNDESTGLAFSPNGKRMYVSFQRTGQIFDIWREDGLPFHGQTLNVRYH